MRVQVTRVERYGGVCEGCEQRYESPVPVGLEPGSPYGASIASVLSDLRYTQAVSYERLSQLMADFYGLAISEGAIANLLQRVHEQLQTPMAAMLARLRQSRLVCSDETGARVGGKTQGLLLRAMALGRRRGRSSGATFAKHRRRLDR